MENGFFSFLCCTIEFYEKNKSINKVINYIKINSNNLKPLPSFNDAFNLLVLGCLPNKNLLDFKSIKNLNGLKNQNWKNIRIKTNKDLLTVKYCILFILICVTTNTEDQSIDFVNAVTYLEYFNSYKFPSVEMGVNTNFNKEQEFSSKINRIYQSKQNCKRYLFNTKFCEKICFVIERFYGYDLLYGKFFNWFIYKNDNHEKIISLLETDMNSANKLLKITTDHTRINKYNFPVYCTMINLYGLNKELDELLDSKNEFKLNILYNKVLNNNNIRNFKYYNKIEEFISKEKSNISHEKLINENCNTLFFNNFSMKIFGIYTQMNEHGYNHLYPQSNYDFVLSETLKLTIKQNTEERKFINPQLREMYTKQIKEFLIYHKQNTNERKSIFSFPRRSNNNNNNNIIHVPTPVNTKLSSIFQTNCGLRTYYKNLNVKKKKK